MVASGSGRSDLGWVLVRVAPSAGPLLQPPAAAAEHDGDGHGGSRSDEGVAGRY
jgi:hypothetical protein